MKKIVLASLAASVTLVASPFHCSIGFEEYCKTEALIVGEQTTITEVVNNTNRMDIANDTKNALGVTGQFIYSGDIKVLNFPLSYNVHDNVGLEATIPLVSVTDIPAKGDDNMGIGDISVGANYHFGHYGSEYGLNVTTLRYKTSTGDEKKGLGIGEDAITLSHNFAKEMGFARMHGLLAYTLNNKDVLGNALNAMVGASRPCLLNDDLRTNVKLTYFDIAEEDTTAGFTNIDLWVEWSSNKIVDGIPLGAGIKLPLVNEITVNGKTGNPDKAILFYLSASSFFD